MNDKQKSPEAPIALEQSGDCAYIKAHDDYLCLVIDDMIEGWVHSKLVIKSSNKTIVDTETYLNGMHIAFSPNSKIFMVEVTAEGHPSFAFYNTDRMLQDQAESETDAYLDEYYFEHFEYIGDNGDVVFSLSEQNGQSCYEIESRSPLVHSPACLVGFNILTKQALAFNQDQLCVFNKQ
ncbi:hypothetical protein N9L48_05330 [Psychrosphaera sp.]|nr:hypothetical protein [Psychrosphaera sp.]